MDIWNIFFLIAAGQGLFLSLLLLSGKGKNQYANRILSAFILLFSLNTFENVAYWTHYDLVIPHVAGSTRGFVFLFGPLLWFYVQCRLDEKWRLKFHDLIHFLPFVIYTLIRLDYYLLNADAKRQIIESSEDFSPALVIFVQASICLHLVVYSWNIFKVTATTDQLKHIFRRIGTGLGIYSVTFIAYYILIRTINLKPEHDYILSIIGIVAIYQVGYLAFAKPEMLHGFSRRDVQSRKYEKSTLTDDEAILYRERITQLMEVEKIYLDTNLRLSDLAGKLSISTNHTSQVINEHFGKTFYELLTSYRLKEALRRLDDPENDEKLLSIALNSGFNNRTSFNMLFKKHVGCSPKDYKEKAKA